MPPARSRHQGFGPEPVEQRDGSQALLPHEARSAASITHENVVAIHQVHEDENSTLPYLVMQLVEGISLQDRLDRGGAMAMREIVRVGYQAAAGLAAAHAKGLIHRDVKPANILIESSHGRVKLTDFGLARGMEDVKLTQTGFVAGTPLYMAPEQASGVGVDSRTDLFSLGSVLYSMATGKPPFEGSTPFVVLKSVTEAKPPRLKELNPRSPIGSRSSSTSCTPRTRPTAIRRPRRSPRPWPKPRSCSMRLLIRASN